VGRGVETGKGDSKGLEKHIRSTTHEKSFCLQGNADSRNLREKKRRDGKMHGGIGTQKMCHWKVKTPGWQLGKRRNPKKKMSAKRERGRSGGGKQLMPKTTRGRILRVKDCRKGTGKKGGERVDQNTVNQWTKIDWVYGSSKRNTLLNRLKKNRKGAQARWTGKERHGRVTAPNQRELEGKTIFLPRTR